MEWLRSYSWRRIDVIVIMSVVGFWPITSNNSCHPRANDPMPIGSTEQLFSLSQIHETKSSHQQDSVHHLCSRLIHFFPCLDIARAPIWRMAVRRGHHVWPAGFMPQKKDVSISHVLPSIISMVSPSRQLMHVLGLESSIRFGLSVFTYQFIFHLDISSCRDGAWPEVEQG